MKVIVIGRTIPEKETGLKGLFEYNQAKALKKKNINVVYAFIDNRSVLELKKIGVYEGTINEVPIYGQFFPMRGLPYKIYDWIKFKQFKSTIEKIKNEHGEFDIIHVHFPLYTLNKYIIDYINSLNVKFVVTEHWAKTQNMELSKREAKNLNSLLYWCDEFVTVSEKLKISVNKYKKQFKNLSGNEITTIPNIIQSDFNYVERITDNYITFVTVGRLTNSKKNDAVIRAFSELSKKRDGLKLLIIGDGPEKLKLKKLISKLKSENKIIITGYLDQHQIMSCFSKADVYLSASSFETFGVPVVESWIMGRPVIIGDNHPLAYLIEDDNGLTYRYSDEDNILVNNLVKSMEDIIDKNIQRKALSEEMREMFSEDNITNKIIDDVYL